MRWMLFLGLFAVAEDVDTVPSDVSCHKIKRCDDNNVCAIVCERGSVQTDPWADAALKFQRKLAYTHSLCHAQLPGSHNSAINMGYGIEDHVFEGVLKYFPWFTTNLVVHTNDQLFSMTDQLRMGTRFIEMDVHWVDDELRIAHCGGFDSSALDDFVSWINAVAKLLGMEIQWDSETVGCKPSLSSIPAHQQRPVVHALEEVAAWVHAPENQGEFLLIYFDDQSNLLKWHKVKLLLDYIKKHFDLAEILKPSDVKNLDHWPTFETLIASGKKVAFLSVSNYSPVGDEILFHKHDLCSWQEPDLPFKPYPECRFKDWVTGTIENDHILFRPETSEIQYGFINAQGHLGPNEYLIDNALIPRLMECNVKIPSPDNLTPNRTANFIWSFAEKEPKNPSDCIVMHRNSSRWYSHDCNTATGYRPACMTAASKNESSNALWSLGAISDGTHPNCPPGSKFGVPTNGYENRVLFDLLWAQDPNTHGIWINAKTIIDQVYMNKDSFIFAPNS
uniref:Secreted protein n=1 Tax=Thraustotheca clavata TaxID=74557 RepID=A0A0A7CMP1_9STRA|nr:secreted protein [Thraustotheca clavata]